MNPVWLIAALVIIGIFLIAVDFYIPGFVLGSIGIIMMLAALVICFRNFGGNWTALLFLLEAVLGGAIGYFAVTKLPQTAAGKRMILSHDQTGVRAGQPPESALVGKEGVAQSLLRPSGMALLDGKRLDVVAESGMIERGSAIRVIAVEGTRIIVRKI